MSNRCAWIIAIGEVDPLAQAIAAQLAAYGVAVKGQKWPLDQPQAWMQSAQEAAGEDARLVIIVTSSTDYKQSDLRRQLSLFRIFLQTLQRGFINGFIAFTDPDNAPSTQSDMPGTPILGDLEAIGSSAWVARAVARLHAPKTTAWPVRLGLFAQEKLGVWLQVVPQPGQTSQGCVTGVSGNDAKITFQAIGAANTLPEKSVNEYELKGLTFETAGHAFTAWGLQNLLTPEQAHFVRLENEPDLLAIGTLPNGELSDVSLIALR